MNIVIICWKIVSKIDFKFIYDRYKNIKIEYKEKYKHTSIAKCKVKLLNNSIVEIYGYDEIEDYMYRNFKENQIIALEGKLDSEMKIEVRSTYTYII